MLGAERLSPNRERALEERLNLRAPPVGVELIFRPPWVVAPEPARGNATSTGQVFRMNDFHGRSLAHSSLLQQGEDELPLTDEQWLPCATFVPLPMSVDERSRG